MLALQHASRVGACASPRAKPWPARLQRCKAQKDASSQGEEGRNEQPKPSGPYSPWRAPDVRGVLQLSQTYSRTDPHYLEIQKREKWWRGGGILKVPHSEPTEDVAQDPNNTLYKKVVPLALLFFFSSFNLTILQALKDAIVVTTSGAEALPFLAALVVLPASVGFLAFYTKMLNIMPRKQVYYAALFPFAAFFGFFASVLYPLSDSLHLHGLFDKVSPYVVPGLHGCIRIAENWTFSIFYAFAELWGTVMISVLFWTLANNVCTIKEAKTVYPMMGIPANIAVVAGGNFIKYMNSTVLAGCSTQTFLQAMVAAILVSSGIMTAVKLWIDRTVQPVDGAQEKKGKKKKSGSLKDSWTTIRGSPKIMNLALIVICYALAHRLFEFAWKGQLRVLFPTAKAYSGALADVAIYTGCVTILLNLTGRFVFEYAGWGTAALATPVIMLLSGATFFALSLAAMHFGVDSSTALLAAGTFAGAMTQVFARSSKYSLFDPAKEMVYIEMDKEEKSKGKAAVDLMGSQAGKTGASGIISTSLVVFGGTASACLPAVAGMYAVVIAVWMRAAVTLKRLMADTELQRQQEAKAVKESQSGGGGGQGDNGGGVPGNGTGNDGNGSNGKSSNGAAVTVSNPMAA